MWLYTFVTLRWCFVISCSRVSKSIIIQDEGDCVEDSIARRIKIGLPQPANAVVPQRMASACLHSRYSQEKLLMNSGRAHGIFLALPRLRVSTNTLRFRSARVLVQRMLIYTCLTQPVNAMVSQHMSRAHLQRPATKVVNDLMCHFESNPSSSDSDSSQASFPRSTLPKRKGGKSDLRKRGK